MKNVSELIKQEEKRQQSTLMMIPSENYTYPEVREAVGSVLMHKYSEGQPGKRFYQGNINIDEIESLCQKRALEAFSLSAKLWGVNVQAYSGSPANLAVYNALLEPGEKILSMYLPDGGHLSHGWELPNRKVTLVSKVWQIDFYHVDSETQVFDYQRIREKAKKVSPKLIISGGTAYVREIDHKALAQIAKEVGAYYLADVAHEAGLIAAGVNKSPFPFADVVTMTTHKTLRGPRGALIFAKREIIEKINTSVFPGIQGGPHNHTIAGIAIALAKTKTKSFKAYAIQTIKNAKRLAEKLDKLGFNIVTGGTDKHSVLIDLRSKTVNGWFVAIALEQAGIITNRNAIPSSGFSAYYPAGLRLGTPAITVRGMKEAEIDKIADWIRQVVDYVGEKTIPSTPSKRRVVLQKFKRDIENDTNLVKIALEVHKLCQSFPVPS